jgi:catechol 2,3-dioxygenase-like lactoylglutathione lyase family enzyme
VTLVRGFHHVAFVTSDLDRLVAFYQRIFDAHVVLDRDDGGRRHALIEIGEHAALHPFEVPADQVPGRQAMFERGRLDHVALDATTKEAFLEIRRRLIAEGAHATEDGLVTDMGGSVWSISFHDPDGMWGEVMWVPPGASFDDIKRPPEWEMIDPETSGQRST